MLPSMSSRETDLLRRLMTTSHDFVEFGAGGSTLMASAMVKRSITSIDSSMEWLLKVKEACAERDGIQPETIHVDIGPLKEWGWPRDETRKGDWINYYRSPWLNPNVSKADTYFIDGRFRVACFLSILVQTVDYPIVAIHDYASRSHYHVIQDFATEIVREGELSVFRKNNSFDASQATAAIKSKYAFDPQ